MSSRTGLIPVLVAFCAARFLGRRRRSLATLLLLTIAAPARGQFVVRSWLPWRTIETRHFEFHYPLPLEAWTQNIAARADAIDSAVARVVGFAPSVKTHIVVDNPYATANGSAWPFLDQPIINLWATPPEPRDDIGEFRNWGEMLVSHEFGHIAHLSRPARGGAMTQLLHALPVDVGPIALRSPRWVIEGYATFIEGRVTGSGRPHGVWRPAVLRQLALEGQLPRYENLNASGAFEGGSFAYLAGSAFLEWLADQRGDSSLILVWRRLTARQSRSFDEAFRGVFGESPALLYGRFTVDVTARALAARGAIAVGADTGEIVQRLAWYTGDPAISPDGQRVALVVRSATLPSRVTVWRTQTEPDTGRARRDSILLARDSGDVPARSIYPTPKHVIASLRAKAGAPYESPRFLRDGRILVSRNAAHGDGSLVPDLYIWDVAHSSVHRVTHGAGVNRADPLPDAHTAVATRCRSGWCELVAVDLGTGGVRVIAEGGPDESFYRPRVSPDGSKAAVAVHTREGWRLSIVDVSTGVRTPVTALVNTEAYDASWCDAASLVVTTEATGVPQLERVSLSGERRQLTNATGAAVAGEPNRTDGSVWYLSLYSRGYELRRTNWNGTVAVGSQLDARLSPAAAVAPSTVPAFQTDVQTPPRPFGLGPRLFRWIPLARIDADGVAGGLALTSRDLIGRSAVMVQGAFGEPAQWRGVSATGEWFGMRPGIRLDVFGVSERTGNVLNIPSGGAAIRFDSRIIGGDAMLDGGLLHDAWAARYRVGGSVSTLSNPDAPSIARESATRSIAFGDASLSLLQRGDVATLTESLGARGTLGRVSDETIRRIVTTAVISLSGRGVLPLTAASTYARTNADAPPFEQIAIGGGAVALFPSIILSQRLPMPVLPSAISIGTSAFTYRASLDTRPLALYWWVGSTAPAGTPFSVWQRVVGAEWTQFLPAIPMAGTPPARAQIGVGESLDAPVRHRLRAYVGLVLDP
jgi:hypothetical protein